MKRITSTMMAAVKDILWKLLLVFLGLAMVDLGLYYLELDSFRIHCETHDRQSFSWFVNESKLAWAYFAALAAVCASCALQGCRFRGKNLYALQRLPLGEWPTTLIWMGVHLLAMLLLWVVQVVMIFVLWSLFVSEFGVTQPGLELFVEVYENDFLHYLVPMADTFAWVMLLVHSLLLSYTTAHFGLFQRRDRFRVEPFIVLATWFLFQGGIGDRSPAYVGLAVAIITVAMTTISVWEVYHGEED